MLGDVFMYDTAISEQTGASQLPQHCFSDLRKKEEDHKKKSNCFTLVYWLRSGMLVPLLTVYCLLVMRLFPKETSSLQSFRFTFKPPVKRWLVWHVYMYKLLHYPS